MKKVKENLDIRLNPVYSYSQNLYKTPNEKKWLVDAIIDDIKEWKNACSQLDRDDNYLGSFCITKCNSCFDWYFKMCENYSELNDGESMKWPVFFKEFEKFNYTCGSECELIDLDETLKKEYIEKKQNRKESLRKVEELQIGYRVAFEQQKNLSKQINITIQAYKEKNAVLIFKKKNLQYVINCIQISIILVSCIITFFEAIQNTIFKNITNDNLTITIIPIICSTYIGLILAIGRFFKFDTRNEQIIKLIEKYSFIINKMRQKRSKYMDFDFKIHNVDEWQNLLSIMEKDSIDDIIMKANEEYDLVLTPKEFTHYKKKYTKMRMKELLERKNFDELSDILICNEELDEKQKNVALNIVKKRNFYCYYFCCKFLCFDRDYVDYKNVLVKNRDLFFYDRNVKRYGIHRNDFSNKNEPRMRILTRNINNLRRELNGRTTTPNYFSNSTRNIFENSENTDYKNTDYENTDYENTYKKSNNNVSDNNSMDDDDVSYSTNRKIRKTESAKVISMRKLGSDGVIDLVRKNNNDEENKKNSNAWLHIQKSKASYEKSPHKRRRSHSSTFFGTITDTSKNNLVKTKSDEDNNKLTNIVEEKNNDEKQEKNVTDDIKDDNLCDN